MKGGLFMSLATLAIFEGEAAMPAGLAEAVSSITDAMGDIASTVAQNPLMLIGIAGGVIGLAAGLFMKLTGQRRSRRR